MKERFLEDFFFFKTDSLWYQWEFNHAAMSEGGEAGSQFPFIWNWSDFSEMASKFCDDRLHASSAQGLTLMGPV